MSKRAEELAHRIEAFNNEVIGLVQQCSDDDWRKMCAWEEWPVGVTARHIAAGHYSILDFCKRIVQEKPLPEVDENQIRDMANQHARKHTDCTREEVIQLLRQNGRSVIDFIAGLDDADLDRTAYMVLAGGDVSTQQLIEYVVFNSGGKHMANIKTALNA